MSFRFIHFLIFSFFSSLIYANANTQEPIVLPLNEWASQRVLTYATGELLTQQGYQVKYLESSVDDQWGALQRGLVHFQIEIWQPSMEAPFTKRVADGSILDLGNHDVTVKESWWFPDYVKALCPDLPNWQALNQCAHLFSTSSSNGRGLYYSGPWEYYDGELIRRLDLNFKIERDGSDVFLWRRLSHALASKQPILMLNWTPNWTDNRVAGQFVDFSGTEQYCLKNGKAKMHSCTAVKEGWLKKAAWPGLKDKWPCAYRLLANIRFDHQMISEAAALTVADGFTNKDAADVWLKKYQDKVNLWQQASCQHIAL